MKPKSILTVPVVVICIAAFVPSVMAATVFAPNVLVFTELSSTQLNVAWSPGSLPGLLASPVQVRSSSPDSWAVGLQFLTRTSNTIGPPAGGNPAPPVPLGWTEPTGSGFNVVTFLDNACFFDSPFQVFDTCILVSSDFTPFTQFRFPPLADGLVFADAARLPGNSTPLDFAFVDTGDVAVTAEPSSIGSLFVGFAALGCVIRRKKRA